jgi:hypothetical protein
VGQPLADFGELTQLWEQTADVPNSAQFRDDKASTILLTNPVSADQIAPRGIIPLAKVPHFGFSHTVKFNSAADYNSSRGELPAKHDATLNTRELEHSIRKNTDFFNLTFRK